MSISQILIPICFISAWLFLLTLGSSIYSACNDTAARAKQMHKIPCTNCQFFTNDYRLKCTIQPTIALTEQAIDCRDYCSRNR
jgi:hypothetical protein